MKDKDLERLVLSQIIEGQLQGDLGGQPMPVVIKCCELIEAGYVDGQPIRGSSGAYEGGIVLGPNLQTRALFEEACASARRRTLLGRISGPARIIAVYLLGLITPTGIEWVKHIFGPHMPK